MATLIIRFDSITIGDIYYKMRIQQFNKLKYLHV